MFVSSHGGRCIPVIVKPDLGELNSTLLKPKENTATKRYKKEILKFMECCVFSGFGRCLLFLLRLQLFIFLGFIRVLAHMPL